MTVFVVDIVIITIWMKKLVFFSDLLDSYKLLIFYDE